MDGVEKLDKFSAWHLSSRLFRTRSVMLSTYLILYLFNKGLKLKTSDLEMSVSHLRIISGVSFHSRALTLERIANAVNAVIPMFFATYRVKRLAEFNTHPGTNTIDIAVDRYELIDTIITVLSRLTAYGRTSFKKTVSGTDRPHTVAFLHNGRYHRPTCSQQSWNRYWCALG